MSDHMPPTCPHCGNIQEFQCRACHKQVEPTAAYEAIALALYGSREEAYRECGRCEKGTEDYIGDRDVGFQPVPCATCYGTGRILRTPDELVSKAKADGERLDWLELGCDVTVECGDIGDGRVGEYISLDAIRRDGSYGPELKHRGPLRAAIDAARGQE